MVNCTVMTKSTAARIPCSKETRRLLKSQKRGGESYDKLLQKMVQQYNPNKNDNITA